MIEESPLESVKSNIVVEFDSSSQAKIIYDSILLEFNTAPDFRSSMTIDLDGSNIIINIDAEDSTSFRASVNSAIKWIKLALEINNLTKKVNIDQSYDTLIINYEIYKYENIMSTLPENKYGYLSGTSMAAPVVSSFAAILRSEFADRDKYPTKFKFVCYYCHKKSLLFKFNFIYILIILSILYTVN